MHQPVQPDTTIELDAPTNSQNIIDMDTIELHAPTGSTGHY